MTAQERLKIIESLGYTITPEMIAHEEEIDNASARRKLAEVESIYGANWEQDADSLREILTNGDSMVLNQSGVEIADEAEETHLPHMQGKDLVWQGVTFDMEAIGANIKANSAKYQAKIKADQAEAARRHEEGKERARKSVGRNLP